MQVGLGGGELAIHPPEATVMGWPPIYGEAPWHSQGTSSWRGPQNRYLPWGHGGPIVTSY